ncbi:GLPGLI family protein [Flavobacterium luminosum]|uniref:GLPGLI family protein n=1 Tax=Flavobacterium luminosum TaxID=2949086 RepID=A0ABT0TMH1_9FLAO|nr:GLPGLI family protein [Flavobacterium sp. HXWNR70]MCL9808688.1 GLPGLI family protein [Flavobacterium sp. HXWNR70]
MKSIYLLFLFLNFNFYAQLKIEYDYTMGNHESSTINKCYLYTDGVNSKFVYRRIINGETESIFTHINPTVLEFMNSKFKKQAGDSIGKIVLKKMNSDSIYCRYSTADNKYVKVLEKNTPIIKIVDEFKTVFNYNCQKAIFDFGERVFEVWFTNDIPISDGPWKLKGLPGLVLSAKTNDGIHHFEITSLKNCPPFEKSFFDFPFVKILSKEVFVDDFIRITENKFKYQKSQKPDANSTMTIDMLDIPKTLFK